MRACCSFVDYVKRFCELGGEIVTIGSDAHDKTRVGQYANEALEMIQNVFPYACIFEKRKPIFTNYEKVVLLDKDHEGGLIKTTDDLTFVIPIHPYIMIKEVWQECYVI